MVPAHVANLMAALPRVLILGFGNRLRQDDGLGPVLAARLAADLVGRGLAVRLRTVPQLTPELATDLAAPGVRSVIFADARPAVEPADRALEMTPVDAGATTSSLGHQATPAMVLAYATLLADPPPPAWLVTAPGFAFGMGEDLSPEAVAALNQALDQDPNCAAWLAELAATVI